MILSGQVSGQSSKDSTLLSNEEARQIDQLLIDALECDSAYKVEVLMSLKKDTLLLSKENEIAVMQTERVIDGRIINMHLHDKGVLVKKIKAQKRINGFTIGISTMVVLGSLFVAIR